MSTNLVNLGTAELDPETKALRVQARSGPVDEDGTTPDYGLVPVLSQLALAAMPWPANDDGAAEGIVAEDVPGLNGALIGARDVRCADVVGKLGPGDVCLFSCGPQHKAQIQLKETKRQVALLSEDKDGNTQMLMLDGAASKFQLLVSGAMIEIDKSGVVTLTAGGGESLVLGNGEVRVMGAKFVAGVPTPGLVVMTGPPSGSPGSVASVPLMPATGICI